MRKLFAFLLIICLFPVCGTAETITCWKCKEEHEISYLRRGDQGIAVQALCRTLIEKGYLPPNTRIDFFDERLENALKHFQDDMGLPKTGIGDEKTLDYLLHGEASGEYSIDPADIKHDTDVFWVPTDGGKRVHSRACCSKMIDPRTISLDVALALEIEPCGVCAKAYRELIDWAE